MHHVPTVLLFALLGCGAAAADKPAAQGQTLKLIQTIPLDGVEGRFDHFDADASRQRLYVAALGNNTVEVIDTAGGARAGTVKDLEKPTGMRVLPDSGNVVIASGDDRKVRVYSPELKLLGTVDGIDDADNVRLSPDGKLAYVGYGDGALAIIDPAGPRKVGDVKLDGHPESFQLEQKGNRMFVNVPDAKHIAVIDLNTRAVMKKWPVTQAQANFPMALDEANARLFIGCRNPTKLLVLDTATGAVVQTLDITGDTDDLFFDPATKRIFITGGAGSISLIRQDDADHYKLIGTTPTAEGARTSFFVPTLKRLYIAVPHRGNQRAAVWVFDTSG